MTKKYQIYSYRVIYAYTLPDAKHSGLIKVADRLVTLEAGELKEAESNPNALEVLVSENLPENAVLKGIWLGTFRDAAGNRHSIKLQDVYNVLLEKYPYVSFAKDDYDKWFKADINDVSAAVTTAQKRETGEEKAEASGKIIFRPEQKDAINMTVDALKKGRKRFLWNAKMRFGKTLCALQVAKDMGYKYTLIITHRPVVDDGWHEDFTKIFTNQPHDRYGSRNVKDEKAKGFEDLIKKVEVDPEGHLVFFASMQYLRGSHLVGAKKKANSKENPEKTAILNFPWDFVVIDEAHEGTQSERGVEVMRYMKLNVPDSDESADTLSAIDAIVEKSENKSEKGAMSKTTESKPRLTSPRTDHPVTLSLSGTPFNLYSEYSPSEIYTWDYVREQKAKKDWYKEHGDDPNPYDVLPRLNIFNLDIEDTIGHRILEPGESEENCTKNLNDESLEDEYAGFNFSNFYKVWDKTLIKQHKEEESKAGQFVHEPEIMEFFYALAKESFGDSNFPFSTPEFKKAFRHTFWLIPGVPQGKALEELLRRPTWSVRGKDVANPYFKGFRVINAAGNEQEDLTGEALRDVKDHIALAKGRLPKRFEGKNPDSLNKKERKEYDELLKKLSEWKGKYTITLSCGKLTTGVSVPDWTAVFYMKGNDSTSASTYMQTIFRVQTPAVVDGAQKTECYLFDFSTVRSLKVFADAVRLNMSSERGNDKTTKYSREDQKKAVKEWMEVLPFQAISVPTPGSGKTRMEPYDPDKLFSQLDARLIDRVIRSGYADNSIYDSVAIMELTDEAEAALARISLKVTSDSKSNQDGGEIKIGPNRPEKPTKRDKKIAEGAAGKSARELTPEEIEAKKKEDEYNKQRRERMKTLRSMSVRIPLLMYGADIENRDELDITNFTTLIDDASWNEFMPSNITKEDFDAVRDCYDSVRFRGSAEKIREFAESSDSLSITDRVKEVARIFSFFHNPDKETVLTPWRVVNMHMSDTIGGYKFFADDNRTLLDVPVKVTQEGVTDSLFITPEAGKFSDIEKVRILEINSKTGLYPLYVAYSLFRARKEHYEAAHALDPNQKIKEDHDIWAETLKENLFVVCKTPMAVSITRRTLAGFTGNEVNAICPTWEVPQGLLVRAGVVKDDGCMTLDPELPVETDLVGILRAKETIEKENNSRAKRGEAPLDLFFTEQVQRRDWWEEKRHRKLDHNKINNDMIKFNAVVGNPPYQLTGGSGGSNDSPIYQYFCESAHYVTDKYCSLIIPSRWFAAGRENLLGTFRNTMLSSNKLEMMVSFPNGRMIFENVEIKGGLCYYRFNSKYKGKCLYLLNQNGKIESSFIELGKFPILIRNPKIRQIVEVVRDSSQNKEMWRPEYKYQSETLDSIMANDTPFGIPSNTSSSAKNPFKIYSESSDSRILVYYIESLVRKIGFVEKDKIKKNSQDIPKYKALIPISGGSGNDSIVLGRPEYAINNSVCSQSYIYAPFDSEFEAKSCVKYYKTKFLRILVAAYKITQSAPNRVYRFVPMQDFTENSDIDWSQSVADIDKQLYKKYGLEQSEIDFIEKMIKPMDD